MLFFIPSPCCLFLRVHFSENLRISIFKNLERNKELKKRAPDSRDQRALVSFINTVYMMNSFISCVGMRKNIHVQLHVGMIGAKNVA